jgi:hypothetical protein
MHLGEFADTMKKKGKGSQLTISCAAFGDEPPLQYCPADVWPPAQWARMVVAPSPFAVPQMNRFRFWWIFFLFPFPFIVQLLRKASFSEFLVAFSYIGCRQSHKIPRRQVYQELHFLAHLPYTSAL